MNVASPRALILSFVTALGLSLVLGSLFAWLGDKVWFYAVGAVMFIIGVIVLVIGLLGAVEPKEGWATGKRNRGRRSLAAAVTRDHPELEEASPIQLGVWGAMVGLPLIALSFVAFTISAA